MTTNTEKLKAACDKLLSDLNWRGASGRTAAYVAMPREHALALLRAGELVLSELENTTDHLDRLDGV